MIRSKFIQVPAHKSIYGKESEPYSRRVNCYYAVPEGEEKTGILVLPTNFGESAALESSQQKREALADKYKLLVMQCDYFGWEFMQEGKNEKTGVAREVLAKVFTEEELDMMYNGDILDFSRMLQLGSQKEEKIVVKIKECSQETLDNCNDQSIMQALDLIAAVSFLISHSEEEKLKLDKRKIIFYGTQHGGYLAHLCNLLAPHLLSLVIDAAAWISPAYLKNLRTLTYHSGNIECRLLFPYLMMDKYDRELVDLNFLYQNLTNESNIIVYQNKNAGLAAFKEKEKMCRRIKNCRFYSAEGSEDILDRALTENKALALRKHSPEPGRVVIETAKAVYTVDYIAALPYVTVKEKKLGLEVAELRKLLFAGKISEMNKKLLVCLDQLNVLTKDFTAEENKLLQEIMLNLSYAMQDHDYLLVTDLLKFEILPLINKEQNKNLVRDEKE